MSGAVTMLNLLVWQNDSNLPRGEHGQGIETPMGWQSTGKNNDTP